MLDDKYRIERLLATGGMGAVYLGTHVGLRKRVAIKVLNPQLSSAPMIERFHREAITASKIGHEGIAQVTDLGTSSDGEPFLVMEYLEGESLASRLKASGPLAVEDACELGCAILSPLAAAHDAGIVHRDLKPDNVYLVRQSRGEMVKLLDFGISRTTGDSTFRLTTTGLVLGTPYYMSPEQARGDSDITFTADLYAFGVMLYEMLIGDVPMRGENYNQLMYRVMTGEYQWPRRRRPELPEALEQVIVRAMALSPGDRPGSANELEQALLPYCRPVFRDHASGRLSAPGLSFHSSGTRRPSGPSAASHPPHPSHPAQPSGPSGPPGMHRPGADHAMLAASTVPDVPRQPSWPGVRGSDHRASDVTGPGLPGAGFPATIPQVTAPGGAVASTLDGGRARSRTARLLTGLAILAAGAVITGSLAIALSGRDHDPVAPAAAPPVPGAPGAPGAPRTPGGSQAPAATPPPQAGTDPGAAPPSPPPTRPAPAAGDDPGSRRPASAGEPAEHATITLRLAVEPAGAAILVDGKRASGTEIVVPRDSATHHLKITAAGYLSHEEDIVFDESQRLVVQLRRSGAPAHGKTPRDPKDPSNDRIDIKSPYD